jgi:MFS family permease
MEDFSLTLIWLGFFASIFFGWYYYLQARNKERMALIERNADVSEIFKPREVRIRFPWLTLGMIFSGVGLGFCLILFLLLIPAIQEINERFEGIMIMGFMFLFGGLGAVIAHFIEKPKSN